MKKFSIKAFLGVLAIAATMAACNNSGVEPAAAASADSATKVAGDSVKPATDSSSMKMDSAAAPKDTTKKM